MKPNHIPFFTKYKYELLLLALIQHLFAYIVLPDLEFYTNYIWPLNMVLLGIASIGVFTEKGIGVKIVKNILTIIVIAVPVILALGLKIPNFYIVLNITYFLYFTLIFVEVLKFLIKPSYINTDIISASACGYFLIIEISTFLFQFFFTQDQNSFKGIAHADNPASYYIDMVYYSAITITSIGFGDITPNTEKVKLLTAFFGVVGQFYSVVLVGILISKFTSRTK